MTLFYIFPKVFVSNIIRQFRTEWHLSENYFIGPHSLLNFQDNCCLSCVTSYSFSSSLSHCIVSLPTADNAHREELYLQRFRTFDYYKTTKKKKKNQSTKNTSLHRHLNPISYCANFLKQKCTFCTREKWVGKGKWAADTSIFSLFF